MKIIHILTILIFCFSLCLQQAMAAIPGTVRGSVYFKILSGSQAGLELPASGQIIVKEATEGDRRPSVTSVSDNNGIYIFSNDPAHLEAYKYMDYACVFREVTREVADLTATLCKNTGNISSFTSLNQLPSCTAADYGYNWCGGNCGANPQKIYVKNPKPLEGYTIVASNSDTVNNLYLPNGNITDITKLYINLEPIKVTNVSCNESCNGTTIVCPLNNTCIGAVCTLNTCITNGNFDQTKCSNRCTPILSTPTPTPTIRPTPTPSPTPIPMVCLNLTTSKTSPQRGDSIVFTCSGSGDDAQYANFRIMKDNQVQSPSGSFIELDKDKRANWSLTIPIDMAEGNYKVQCQICANNTSDSRCTNWSLAQ